MTESNNYDSNNPKYEDLPQWAKDWCEKWNGHISDDGKCLISKLNPDFIINMEQYELLKNYSTKIWGKHKKWNQYRQNNKPTLLLCGACLDHTDLRNKNLSNAKLFSANLESTVLYQTNFKNAILWKANLNYSDAWKADFSNTILFKTSFNKTSLWEVNFKNAHFWEANLENAELSEANLTNTTISNSNLSKTVLNKTNLQKTKIIDTNLQQANFTKNILQGTRVIQSDLSKARIFDITLDSRTDFTGSNIDSALMDPAIKGQLEYNIRRLSWHKWFNREQKESWIESIATKIVTSCTRWFWSVSDYGISSIGIIGWFITFSILFAIMYWQFPSMLDGESGGFMQCLYFSVVTMTTLGFGDIHADPASIAGQSTLIVQVILGYVLLGALITRLGVVFTSLGPVPKPELAKSEKLISRYSTGMFLIFIPAGILTALIKLCPYLPWKYKIIRLTLWIENMINPEKKYFKHDWQTIKKTSILFAIAAVVVTTIQMCIRTEKHDYHSVCFTQAVMLLIFLGIIMFGFTINALLSRKK